MLAGALGDPVQSAYLVAGVIGTALGVLVLGPVLAVTSSTAAGRAGQPRRRRRRRAGPRQRHAQPPADLGDGAAPGGRDHPGHLPGYSGRRHQGVGHRRPGPDLAGRLPARRRRRRHAPAHISPRVAERLAGLPELAAVAAFRDANATVAGRKLASPPSIPSSSARSSPWRRPAAPTWSDLDDGDIAVSRQAADDLHLAVGSPVTVHAPGPAGPHRAGGLRPLRPGRLRPPAAAHRRLPGHHTADHRRLTGEDGLTRSSPAGATRSAPPRPGPPSAGPSPAAPTSTSPAAPSCGGGQRRRSTPRAAAVPGLLDRARDRAVRRQHPGLSVLERARELGLLRAIGMDRRQVRAMIRWEAVIIAAIGATIGLGLGAFIGWAVSETSTCPPPSPPASSPRPPRPRSPPASSPRPCPPAEPPRSTCSAPSPRVTRHS